MTHRCFSTGMQFSFDREHRTIAHETYSSDHPESRPQNAPERPRVQTVGDVLGEYYATGAIRGVSLHPALMREFAVRLENFRLHDPSISRMSLAQANQYMNQIMARQPQRQAYNAQRYPPSAPLGGGNGWGQPPSLFHNSYGLSRRPTTSDFARYTAQVHEVQLRAQQYRSASSQPVIAQENQPYRVTQQSPNFVQFPPPGPLHPQGQSNNTTPRVIVDINRFPPTAPPSAPSNYRIINNTPAPNTVPRRTPDQIVDQDVGTPPFEEMLRNAPAGSALAQRIQRVRNLYNRYNQYFRGRGYSQEQQYQASQLASEWRELNQAVTQNSALARSNNALQGQPRLRDPVELPLRYSSNGILPYIITGTDNLGNQITIQYSPQNSRSFWSNDSVGHLNLLGIIAEPIMNDFNGTIRGARFSFTRPGTFSINSVPYPPITQPPQTPRMGRPDL